MILVLCEVEEDIRQQSLAHIHHVQTQGHQACSLAPVSIHRNTQEIGFKIFFRNIFLSGKGIEVARIKIFHFFKIFCLQYNVFDFHKYEFCL